MGGPRILLNTLLILVVVAAERDCCFLETPYGTILLVIIQDP